MSGADGLFQPGRNCWRVERADRFYCVQDAADYFRLVRQALLSARDTAFILGWDILATVDLLPAGPDVTAGLAGPERPALRENNAGSAGPKGRALPEEQAPTRLDDLLRFVARRRPHLRVYILIWDFAALYTLERDPFSRWRLGWRMPRRVRFGFDDRHPLGGSHHQKVIVVDDQLAFCGGIDLTSHRWDTKAHRVEEPARTSRGEPYEPYHEVQAMVTGPAAKALGILARDRWRELGGEHMPPVGAPAHDLWPSDITPDLADVNVAISRTMPGIDAQSTIRECEALFLDSIARAKASIYIESQYFTNDKLGAALAARLREPRGPEIVVVAPRECHGWIELNTMGAFRDRVFRELNAADTHQRLRLVYPAASRSRGVPTFIHSKVMIVDDVMARIGSANFSRRSMGVDSECDLAVEANGNRRGRAGIHGMRNRLLAEHLGMPEEDVANGIADTGSVCALIDARAQADRTLVRIETPVAESPLSEALRAAADPDEPLGIGSPITGVLPAADATGTHRGVGAYVMAALVRIPLELFVIGAGVLLGAKSGGVIAWLGSLVAAVVGYSAGRAIGATRLSGWMSPRSYRSARQLGAQGVTGVIVLRLASVATAGSINMLCGAARVPFATYMAGTAIGMLPAIAALTALGAVVRYTFLVPSLPSAVTAAGGFVLGGLFAIGLRTLMVTRQFGPSLSSHRVRAEFG